MVDEKSLPRFVIIGSTSGAKCSGPLAVENIIFCSSLAVVVALFSVMVKLAKGHK